MRPLFIFFTCIFVFAQAAVFADPPKGRSIAPPALPSSPAGQEKTTPVIVNVLAPQKTDAQAKEEREEAAKKTNLDTRLVQLTADLARYTRWLAYGTIALVIFTAFLAVVASKQARDARDLFLRDQRPWLNVSISARNEGPNFNKDGGITLPLRVSCKNIGKTPAFEAANGWMLHIGYDNFEEAFQSIRTFTEAQSFSKGLTIFPGDDDTWETDQIITKKQIEESRSIEERGTGAAMQFLIVCYKYKSGFSKHNLEIVRMYKFGIGFFEGPLPDKVEEAFGKPICLKLWKEFIT